MRNPFSYIALMAFGLMLPSLVWAEVEGEIVPVGGTHQYTIKVDNTDITSNQAGATISNVFDLAGSFPGRAYCSRTLTNQPVYFTSQAALTKPGSSPGYLYLNEFMDVKIEIFIGGNLQQYRTVPFDNVSNGRNQNQCTPPSSQLENEFASGAKGRVTFMITKPIINGVDLTGTEIAQLFGRLGSGPIGSTPLSLISIASGVITVPDKCRINEGRPVVVDFGSIPGSGSKLDGTRYSQNVPIRVKCEGGSFSQGALNIKLKIHQDNPAFSDGKYLSTSGPGDRSELAISLKDAMGSPVVPNTLYNVPGFTNNEGSWNLVAAPLAKSPTSAIPEGAFSASATIVAEFQ